MDTELTRSKARQLAKEATDPINKIINHNDLIHQDVENWENVDIDRLEDELFEGASRMITEQQQPYHSLCHDLALNIWREGLPRVSIDDLVYSTKEKAVCEGYWPYEMNKWEVTEILEENTDKNSMVYHECYSEAREEVLAGIIDGYLKELK